MNPEKESPEAKGETEGMSSKGLACPVCGSPQEEWKENRGEGIRQRELLYCSRLCAERALPASRKG